MKVTIITGSRADWNGLGMVGKCLRDEYKIAVNVIAIGQHADNADSVQAIVEDGFKPRLLQTNFADDMAIGCASAALTVASALGPVAPDMVLVLGDRFEILGAATACALHGFKLAHIGGGDITEGSIDNKLRYAITALADLHFATNRQSAEMIAVVNEALVPQNVFNIGAPALDRIRTTEIVSKEVLHHSIGLQIAERNILVMYHAATANLDTVAECKSMLNALRSVPNAAFLIIGTNADRGSQEITWQLQQFVRDIAQSVMRENLSPSLFYSVLTHFDLMVGNSSAGLVETAGFGIPVVNIGNRQTGRIAPRNVRTYKADQNAIWYGVELAKALPRDPQPNPYGDGHSAPRISKVIAEAIK
jgi:UDP-hydrolysing UDP-N-acetyl-D-glucosamine 2-epimerase